MIKETTLFILIFLTVMMFVVPRKYFFLPFVIAVCFIPRDQRLLIVGLDFTVLRIIILAGIYENICRL